MSHIDYPNNNNPDSTSPPNYSSQSEFNSALNKGDRGYYGNDNGGPYPNSNSQMTLYALITAGGLTAGNHSPPSSAPLGMWADVSDSDAWGPAGINPPANWKEVTPLYSATANYAMAAFVQDREPRSATLGIVLDDNGAVAGPHFSSKSPNSNLKK